MNNIYSNLLSWQMLNQFLLPELCLMILNSFWNSSLRISKFIHKIIKQQAMLNELNYKFDNTSVSREIKEKKPKTE